MDIPSSLVSHVIFIEHRFNWPEKKKKLTCLESYIHWQQNKLSSVPAMCGVTHTWIFICLFLRRKLSGHQAVLLGKQQSMLTTVELEFDFTM